MSGQINRSKSSNHPSNGIGIFTGTVLSFVNGRANILVEAMNATYLNVQYAGKTNALKLKKNDKVLCAFLNQKTEEIVILGATNSKVDVFATVVKFNALIDQLQTHINSLKSELEQSAISLQSFKQELQ